MKLKIHCFDGLQKIIECKSFEVRMNTIHGYLNYVDLDDNRITIYDISKIETVEESIKE